MAKRQTENLTISQAIQEMRLGKKVRHKYFLKEEYLYWKNGHPYTEDGYKSDMSFHKGKGKEAFKADWRVVGPKETES